MKKILLTFMLLVSMVGTIRADFVLVYQNTDNPSSVDYRKKSVWTRAKTFPSIFLENRPVEISNIYVLANAVEVSAGATVTVTFVHNPNGADYFIGNHPLNILGVDIVNADGAVVWSDYHYEKAGPDTDAHMYTLPNVDAGVYTLRCFVCSVVGTDVITYASGNISVAGAERTVADGVYELKNRGISGSRGYFVYSSQYPGCVKVAEGALPDYDNASKSFANRNAAGLNSKWCLVTSTKGRRYIFNLNNGEFLSDIDDAVRLVEERPSSVTVQASVKNSAYFQIKNLNRDVYLSNCIDYGLDGEQVRWLDNLEDDAIPVEFVASSAVVDESVMLRAREIIESDEPDKILSWTLTTQWDKVDETCYTSVVMNDNCLGDGVFCHDYAVPVAGARSISATFDYESVAGSSCALNLLGVEFVDSLGNIVAGDYHPGFAGSTPRDNRYCVDIAEQGTYIMRVYATSDSGNEFNKSNGTITLSFDEVEISVFDYDVEFKAEYATLHLGYKVAVPDGVEVYVVNRIMGSWARMEKLDGVIPAATPVVLKNVGDETVYRFTYTDEEATPVENLLEGSISGRNVMGDAYIVAMNDGAVGFYLVELDNGSFLNNANKAYLPLCAVPASHQGSVEMRFVRDTATSVVVGRCDDIAAPCFYDLSGRCVNLPARHGIYILDGRKVYVGK